MHKDPLIHIGIAKLQPCGWAQYASTVSSRKVTVVLLSNIHCSRKWKVKHKVKTEPHKLFLLTVLQNPAQASRFFEFETVNSYFSSFCLISNKIRASLTHALFMQLTTSSWLKGDTQWYQVIQCELRSTYLRTCSIQNKQQTLLAHCLQFMQCLFQDGQSIRIKKTTCGTGQTKTGIGQLCSQVV